MSLITYLTKIQFEAGAVKTLPDELKLLGAKNPLIITDKGIVAAGLIARVLEAGRLPQSTPVFDGTPENPTEAAVLAARDQFVAAKCDAIVAVGGGSALDLAKAVSLLATHPEPLSQYAAILGGVEKITAKKPPVIAIPTTAGTGSEVGRAALVTLNDGRKLGFISPHMIPTVAICDPELTVGLPPRLTAATGMDTVTHCVETFLSPRYNPPADAIALDGLGRAMGALRKVVENGKDIAARTEMMMAALQGGLTFQKGLGAVHGMSHPLGGLKEPRLHHGTLNAVILPFVLRFNESHAGAKYERLRAVLGLGTKADLADAFDKLNVDLGLPRSLAAMAVPADCIPAMVEGAVKDHSTATNPRPVGAAEYAQLFREAML